MGIKGNLVFCGPTLTTSDRIVIAPTTDQFDILRVEHCDATNYGLDTSSPVV
jgi:hypothetical protein